MTKKLIAFAVAGCIATFAPSLSKAQTANGGAPAPAPNYAYQPSTGKRNATSRPCCSREQRCAGSAEGTRCSGYLA